MTDHTAEHRSQYMNECIDNCMRCHAMCLETINYCLGEGGQHADGARISLLKVCADICMTSAGAMLLGAAAHAVTCAACAQICRQCAQSCEAMGDPEMDRCARLCRRCADSCDSMAGG